MSINLAVLYGGCSVEHEISVITAVQAMHSMNRQKYNVLPVYITKSGVMYTGEKLLDISSYKEMSKLLDECSEVCLCRQKDGVYLNKLSTKLFEKPAIAKIDLAFPIVHGTFCEDGSIQGYLETLRLPYVGPDVYASAIGMNKIGMKEVLAQNGIPIVKYISFTAREWYNGQAEITEKIKNDFNFPVIVKPYNLGSSVGISKADNETQLIAGINQVFSYTDRAIIEMAVLNLKEINCSVLGNTENAVASVCEEPVNGDAVLSYQDKYITKSGSSKGMQSLKRKLPAEISAETEQKVKELAIKSFKALGGGGVARIDFLMNSVTNELYVNEINTIPGSLSFYLWEATGKPYSQLIDELVELAYARQRQRDEINYSFDINIFSMEGLGGFKGKK